MINFAVLVIFLLDIGLCIAQYAPEVHVQGGIVRGRIMESKKGRTFYSYTAIRYAKPPVGNLRFEAPVAPDQWDGIFDAVYPHGICPQINIFDGDFIVKGDEDCLFLNVYIPQLQDASTRLLPVIMYIHGGSFEIGTASSFAMGPEILMDKDFILVVPNYRLGPLGFLSTGDEVVPGNNGLKDQAFALKWIKDNIKGFGGNPEHIVVYGHSAGGAAAHFHMLSPLTKGLIKGVVAQSGVALATWALSKGNQTASNSKKLAQVFNCPTHSSSEMINCLRKIDARTLILQKPIFLEWGADPIVTFKPTIEGDIKGAFLPKHPIDIIESGEAADIPFVTGIATDDGAIKTALYHKHKSLIEQLNNEFDRISPITLEYNYQNKDVAKIVRSFYFGDKDIDENTRDELTKLYTDSFMFLGIDESVRLHTKYSKQPVYYYLFGYRGSESYGTFFGYPSKFDYGVCHGDELLYVFNLSLFPNPKRSADDEKMIEIFTSIWENFATTGNPTPASGESFEKWEPVRKTDIQEPNYYYIKSPDSLRMEKGLYSERVNFWRNLGVYFKTSHEIHSEL